MNGIVTEDLEGCSDVQERPSFSPPGPPLGRDGLPRNPQDAYDHLGRKQPHTVRLTSLLAVLWPLAPSNDYIRPVPHQAIDDSQEDDAVHCPCGTIQVTPVGQLVKCAGCERYYVGVGSRVAWVIYGDMEPPPRAAAEPETPAAS